MLQVVKSHTPAALPLLKSLSAYLDLIDRAGVRLKGPEVEVKATLMVDHLEPTRRKIDGTSCVQFFKVDVHLTARPGSPSLPPARLKFVDRAQKQSGILFDQMMTRGVKPPDRASSIHSFRQLLKRQLRSFSLAVDSGGLAFFGLPPKVLGEVGHNRIVGPGEVKASEGE